MPESFMAASRGRDPVGLPGGAAYAGLIEAARDFLDDLAGAVPDAATADALASDLRGWGARLRELAVPEHEQAFGHRVDLDSRGQVMAPWFVMTEKDRLSVRGSVTFGRYFLGGNGAVHGGAVALLFDEVLGRLSDTSGRPPGRTAYLHTDYRAVAPVGRELRVSAWFEKEEGRKRFLAGQIRDGDTLVAEARALFVTLTARQR